MKKLIVYASIHRQNTEKVAQVMTDVPGADLVRISQAQPDNDLEGARVFARDDRKIYMIAVSLHVLVLSPNH